MTATLSLDAAQESVTAVGPTPLIDKPDGVDGAVRSAATAGCTTLVGADCFVVEPEVFVAVTATRIV